MASPSAKRHTDLTALPHGVHTLRFEARRVGFNAFIWKGNPGPVILITGATHGDEYEGPTLLSQWAQSWRPSRLNGTVVAVPILNEAAFFAGNRCTPSDDGNLARAFPGTKNGGHTSRLAHLFDTQLLAQCTHYVDLHSAGAAYELLPWVGFLSRKDTVGRAQRAMATCFDQFWCWSGPFLPGRTLSAAHARNIPAVYVECRGAGSVHPQDLRALHLGLRQLLRWSGVVSGPLKTLRPQKLRESADSQEAHLQVHHPAPHHGLFIPDPTARIGAKIQSKQILGAVLPSDCGAPSLILAERTGTIVMLRRQRSVSPGDALCTIAPM